VCSFRRRRGYFGAPGFGFLGERMARGPPTHTGTLPAFPAASFGNGLRNLVAPWNSNMNQTSFLKRRKILVVEDEADQLELLKEQFKLEGFAIATAANGLDAVRKARSLLPDLILLDVMLPELDGFGVCEVLRKDETTAEIPIIMVTGLPGQLTRCAGIESGATEFIHKPVEASHLVNRAKKMIMERAKAAESLNS
jgi:CheY-like chemotaxis protein